MAQRTEFVGGPLNSPFGRLALLLPSVLLLSGCHDVTGKDTIGDGFLGFWLFFAGVIFFAVGGFYAGCIIGYIVSMPFISADKRESEGHIGFFIAIGGLGGIAALVWFGFLTFG
ncbi:MAG: hypothetical protein IH991_00285 [Planctomycetes bacterium]|nr:hypothetical protein [Planctomycetota bacterium]